jgi:hypothetical protein
MYQKGRSQKNGGKYERASQEDPREAGAKISFKKQMDLTN